MASSVPLGGILASRVWGKEKFVPLSHGKPILHPQDYLNLYQWYHMPSSPCALEQTGLMLLSRWTCPNCAWAAQLVCEKFVPMVLDRGPENSCNIPELAQGTCTSPTGCSGSWCPSSFTPFGIHELFTCFLRGVDGVFSERCRKREISIHIVSEK